MRLPISKTHVAVVMAVLLVSAGLAVGLSTDTETTDTPETSDLTSSTVITEPHNDSATQRVQIIGDSNTNTSSLANPEEAFKLEFIVNETDHDQDGTVLYSTTENWTVQTVSAAPDHYHLNVTNSQFGDELEYGADENVTVDARVTFNESESDESVHNITFTVAPEGDDARLQFAPGERETAAEESFLGVSVASLPFMDDDDPGAARVSDIASVNDNTSNITLHMSNGSTTDAFSETASAADTGALTLNGYVLVDDTMVPLFVESADASWLDTSSEAYATVSSDGTEVTIHNANETYDEGTTSVEIEATGNDKAGFWETRAMLSAYDAGLGAQVSAAAKAVDVNGEPDFEE